MSVRAGPRCPGQTPMPSRLHAVLSAGVAQKCVAKTSPMAQPTAHPLVAKINALMKQAVADIGAPLQDDPTFLAGVENVAKTISIALQDGTMQARELADVLMTYQATQTELTAQLESCTTVQRELEQQLAASNNALGEANNANNRVARANVEALERKVTNFKIAMGLLGSSLLAVAAFAMQVPSGQGLTGPEPQALMSALTWPNYRAER